MVFGVILAGGVGTRMQNAPLPKQFLPLGDKPILFHSLDTFLAYEPFDAIYVGIHPDWEDHLRDQIDARYPETQRKRIHIAVGGGDRHRSLLNVLDAITDVYGDDKAHIVVTHDAVRPFVTVQMIEENIAAARECGAVNTVIPAVDTMLYSENGQVIDRVADRSRLYRAQTPQSFRMSELKALYAALDDTQREKLTDACSVFVAHGKTVRLVQGSPTNLKITTPDDYTIAQALIR